MYEDYEKIRNELGLKDADVARQAGIPQSTFSDWKKGKSIPKYQKLRKIANVLGCEVTELDPAPKGMIFVRNPEMHRRRGENGSILESMDYVMPLMGQEEKYSRKEKLIIEMYRTNPQAKADIDRFMELWKFTSRTKKESD